MSNPILDRDGNLIGQQDADGTLRDSKNKKVGHITREGVVYNSGREQVGVINTQGDVHDRYGRHVGSIAQDGTVQDWHGIPVYSGSAAPLLIDFDKTDRQDALAGQLDFDQKAREAKPLAKERTPLSILPDGFVSPSVIGCLGIIAAVVIGIGIMFVLQNPSMLSGGKATPTLGAVANKTGVTASSDKTAVPDDAPKLTPTAQEATGKVNTQILNLRQGPATSFEIVDRLQQDTEVTITGRLSDNVWLKVTVPSIGKDGWLAAQYIDTQANLDALPIVPPPAQ